LFFVHYLQPEYDSTSDSTGSVLSAVGISAVSCKTLANVGTDKSTVGRAASWAIHFDRLMSDDEGVETFSVSFISYLCVI